MAETLAAWSQPLAMLTVTPEMRDIIQAMARRFMDRARANPQWTPAELDFAAGEFWVGATVLAASIQQTRLAEALGKIGSLEVMRRGYNAIVEMAQ